MTKLNLSEFWSLFSIPEPVPEYKFLNNRKFRFDYCWPKWKTAVEVEGGIWLRGAAFAHNRPIHFMKDIEKYNLAAFHGWTVFRFSPSQFKNGEAGEFLQKYFEKHI